MISGTKISQLPVITTFADTDYVPVQRGSVTNRASGLTIKDAALSAVNQVLPIRYSNNVLTLSSNTISLTGTQININTTNLSVSGSQILSVSSTTPALRIIQTGSGNAITVEDSANPDATPFVVTSSGNVGVGTLTPANKLHVHTTSSNTSSDAHILITQTTNSNSGFIAVDSNGYTRIGGVSGVGIVTDTGQVISILSGGKVGINTTTPDEQLTVIGNVKVSNDIIANSVVANLSGNANTSNNLYTPRTIFLSGSLLGSASFDGSQDITINTSISTGVIVDSNIANNAAISDVKLGPIVSDKKVSPTAIDYTGSLPDQVLMSTGASTVWKSLSSTSFIPLSNSVTNEMLNYNAVTTDRIADLTVTTEKIADFAITTQKLSAQAVTTDKILDQAVTTDKIADQAVTTDKIADNSINTIKLSAQSVSTDKIANLAITTDKLFDAAVTPQKAYAFSTAVVDSFVLRDSDGSLSATNITANLIGNAQTATALATPMTLQLTGDIIGQTSFSGNTSATLTTTLAQPNSLWAVYKANADGLRNLSGTYVQGSSIAPSNIINVTLPISSSSLRQEFGTFSQDNFTISILLSTTQFVNWFNETYFDYNLLPTTQITATFSDADPLPVSGTYIIDSTVFQITSTKIDVQSVFLQNILSGNVTITYDETVLNFLHDLLPNHLVNAVFTTAIPLSGTTAITPNSGIYIVDGVPNAASFSLSTNVEQALSGDVYIRQCTVVENYGIPNVTYLDVGRHILNFKYPFNGNSMAHFHIGTAGSGTPESALSGAFSSSIEKSSLGYQAPEYLEIRSILNEGGTLSFHDFNRTSVICFGNRSM